jgi:hypothetical protein
MSAVKSQDRWVTTREVADRLSIHRDTVLRKVKAGEFGKVLMLSMTDKRIRESAIEEFINSRLA